MGLEAISIHVPQSNLFVFYTLCRKSYDEVYGIDKIPIRYWLTLIDFLYTRL